MHYRYFLLNETYDFGLNWYRKNLPCVCKNEMTVEKTPLYFSTSYVPQRVYNMNNHMKMILMLRDPVERTISDFGHTKWDDAVNENQIWNDTFEELLLDNAGNINTSHPIIDRSVYYDSMINWLSWFDRKQFLLLSSERFTKQPYDTLRKVEEFLNLKTFFHRQMFYYDEKKGFYCYILNHEPKCMSRSKGLPHVKIQVHVRKQLIAYYRKKNRDFNKLVNETFPWSNNNISVVENNDTGAALSSKAPGDSYEFPNHNQQHNDKATQSIS